MTDCAEAGLGIEVERGRRGWEGEYGLIVRVWILGKEIQLGEGCKGMLETVSLEEDGIRVRNRKIDGIMRVNDIAMVSVGIGISEGSELLKDVNKGFCGKLIAVCFIGGVEDAFGIRVL